MEKGRDLGARRKGLDSVATRIEEIQIGGALNRLGVDIKALSKETFRQRDENFDAKINAPKS
jgi:hypothetical protein